MDRYRRLRLATYGACLALWFSQSRISSALQAPEQPHHHPPAPAPLTASGDLLSPGPGASPPSGHAEPGRYSLAHTSSPGDHPGITTATPHSHSHSHSHTHSHHSHSPPKLLLNESAILLTHQASPLSYLAHDRKLVVSDPATGRLGPHPDPGKTYPPWIILHAVGMSLAWFVCLPLAIVTAKSRLVWLPIAFRIGFVFLLAVSLIASTIYRSFTPDLYVGQKHSILGWVLISIGFTSSLIDIFPIFKRIGSSSDCTNRSRCLDYDPIRNVSDDISDRHSESFPQSPKDYDHLIHHVDHQTHPVSSTKRILVILKAVIDRAAVLGASAAALSGVVVYAGACRAEYINGCMAHFIKGGIFFWYGILTWVRYLGGFPELGWPWHQPAHVRSSSRGPSAEMVESAVVFFYGSTNVWMERFGAKAGAPYTVKQVQHISIAAMFAFGGLVGVLLETRAVRRLLFGPRETATGNAFPTLCITITGIAMSLHAQEYAFQVTIHALWGALLGLFGLLRWLTYALASDARGPPVTEALGSVCLIAGGAVFMESVEEVTFTAMRHQFDDVMAFLNVTIAFVCLVMAWTLVLMTIKRINCSN